MEIHSFGTTSDGIEASLITIKNKNGMRLSMTDFGAAIVSIIVPDKNGNPVDVALGFDNAASYEDDTNAFGGTVGRVGNRISEASFTLDGKTYTLDVNDGTQCLHSGFDRYHKRLWNYQVNEEDCSISFSLHSPDMDQHFPGALDVTVTYLLDDQNGLHIRYFAISDAPTLINMFNHTYFNLNGHNSGSVLDHELTIYADFFTENNANGCPNGNILNVHATPFDFTVHHAIGERIADPDKRLQNSGGYDLNYVLNAYDGEIRKVADVYAPQSGITMKISTDTPGMQLYTGNFIGENTLGKEGAVYQPRFGVCFETQDFPDAIHFTHFPSIIYDAGEPYCTETVYTFDVK